MSEGVADAISFADREFYQDWWNSTSWDQFSRKWNKPVHVSIRILRTKRSSEPSLLLRHSAVSFCLVPLDFFADNAPNQTFLLRHVYASTMDGLQLSRTSATFLTFLLSALCHELVMAVVTKKIRPYLFLMQVGSWRSLHVTC
jgi:sterol O-acyltransferase